MVDIDSSYNSPFPLLSSILNFETLIECACKVNIFTRKLKNLENWFTAVQFNEYNKPIPEWSGGQYSSITIEQYIL